MTWGTDEPHCGDPVAVTLTRQQWRYLRDLFDAEQGLDLESRHLGDDEAYQSQQIERALHKAARRTP